MPARLTLRCTFTLTNRRNTRIFFVLCCVVSIVWHGLILIPRKATGADFILLKVIDSHLYSNFMIKDLEKSKYSGEPKTASVRAIFKKNERKKTVNYTPVSILNGMSKYFLIITFVVLKQYQISYQLIANSIVQIMSY